MRRTPQNSKGGFARDCNWRWLRGSWLQQRPHPSKQLHCKLPPDVGLELRALSPILALLATLPILSKMWKVFCRTAAKHEGNLGSICMDLHTLPFGAFHITRAGRYVFGKSPPSCMITLCALSCHQKLNLHTTACGDTALTSNRCLPL